MQQLSSPTLVDCDNLVSLCMEYRKICQRSTGQPKRAHNRNARDRYYKVVDHTIIHMLSAMTGKAWNMVCPYHGPFYVLSTTLELYLVVDTQ